MIGDVSVEAAAILQVIVGIVEVGFPVLPSKECSHHSSLGAQKRS